MLYIWITIVIALVAFLIVTIFYNPIVSILSIIFTIGIFISIFFTLSYAVHEVSNRID